MFYRGDHYVVPRALTRKGQPLQRQIVELAPAAGEDDFIILGTDQCGQLSSGGIHRGSQPKPKWMRARWIAKDRTEERKHGFEHGRVNRCSRIEVEINRVFRHVISGAVGSSLSAG